VSTLTPRRRPGSVNDGIACGTCRGQGRDIQGEESRLHPISTWAACRVHDRLV